MSTTAASVYEWNDLPWKTIEQRVFKLQKRIYRASRRGDQPTVHKLQRLLMKSWSTKCVAVRKVTQDNQGKKTAGVDGVKALTPPQRQHLVQTLQLTEQALPTRRVWIPKPNSTEKRPLGIPTIRTRAEQTLVKLALEPEWEAQFEPNSYGFRAGRSCHDAIEAIFTAIKSKPKYVLDADLAQCFDRINHQALLTKLHTFPTLRRAIRAWLQAGVLDGTELQPTTEGASQGAPLSPLLANVALHGLETTITSAFPSKRQHHGQQQRWQPIVIRFADDFVVLHPDRAIIEQCQRIATEWLADMGLELKPSKTRITHTLHLHDGNVGFNFLGFNVRQYPVGKTHTGKTGGYGRTTVPLGFKTIIKPSKEAIKRHTHAIGTMIKSHRTMPQHILIEHLNPLIRGWSRYYATVASKAIFARIECDIYRKLRYWAKRRHPQKASSWVARKYWRLETGRWDFGTPEGIQLQHHTKTPIRRHTKVRGTKSPFDGDWPYWASRRSDYIGTPSRIASLLKRQHGKCAWCGLYFREEDLAEMDHRIPTARGGMHRAVNWQLIHRHCHDQKTAQDGSHRVRGTDDNSQID